MSARKRRRPAARRSVGSALWRWIGSCVVAARREAAAVKRSRRAKAAVGTGKPASRAPRKQQKGHEAKRTSAVFAPRGAATRERRFVLPGGTSTRGGLSSLKGGGGGGMGGGREGKPMWDGQSWQGDVPWQQPTVQQQRAEAAPATGAWDDSMTNDEQYDREWADDSVTNDTAPDDVDTSSAAGGAV